MNVYSWNLLVFCFNSFREIDTLLEFVDLRIALQEENMRIVRESIQATMKETEKALDSLDHLNDRAKVKRAQRNLNENFFPDL